MKRSITRVVAGATIFASLAILFQNCGPAKVSTDGVEVTSSSADLGSNSGGQDPSGSNPPPSSTPQPTTTPVPGSTPAATPVPTPTPVQGPAMKASASSVDFGTVTYGTRSASKLVTLTNIGTATVSILNKTVIGNDFGLDFFGTGICGNSIAPGASCKISVYFDPFGFGSVTSMLQITTNAPDSPTLIQLKGDSNF